MPQKDIPFETMTCSKCGAILAPTMEVCVECGAKVELPDIGSSGDVVGDWLNYLGAEEEEKGGEKPLESGAHPITQEESPPEPADEQVAVDTGDLDEIINEPVEAERTGPLVKVGGKAIVRYEELDSAGQLAYRIDNLQILIDSAKKTGEFVGDAQSTLEDAKARFRDGDLPLAFELSEKTRAVVDQMSIQYRVLHDTINTSEKAIKVAYDLGGNVEEAKGYLEMARVAMERLDYEQAIGFAIKSGISARKARTSYESWKAEIDDWL